MGCGRRFAELGITLTTLAMFRHRNARLSRFRSSPPSLLNGRKISIVCDVEGRSEVLQGLCRIVPEDAGGSRTGGITGGYEERGDLAQTEDHLLSTVLILAEIPSDIRNSSETFPDAENLAAFPDRRNPQESSQK